MTLLAAETVEATDDEDLRPRHRAAELRYAVLIGLVVVTASVGVSLGPVRIPVDVVWRVIGHHLIGYPAVADWTLAQDNITWLVRVPRVLLGLAVGAALAVTGAALQALVRNILAEPYLIGVSSGASTGAAVVLLFGTALFGAAGSTVLAAAAFGGGLAATALVFLTARTGGRLTPMRLVLAGVTVAYALSAVTSFLIFASDRRDGARGVLFWLLGSLDQARWDALPVPTAATLLVTAVLLLWGRRLDAVAIGDDTALSLGTSPTRFRTQAFLVVALGVGAVVAVAGPIGFVGLVVPHLARRWVGGTHRRMLPVAALLGAVFLVWADVLARVAFAPREMPLGIVTALVGAPFLLLLIRRLHSAA